MILKEENERSPVGRWLDRQKGFMMFEEAGKFINESIEKIADWDDGSFMSTMCMLIEEYCVRHALSAKDMMRTMADVAEMVEHECGVYMGGELVNG